MLSLGSILYVSLLLINAMAVLSEDRFLAKSALFRWHFYGISELIKSVRPHSWLGVDTGAGGTSRVCTGIRAAV